MQHDANKSIKIMAYASIDGDYPDTMQPAWAEEEHGTVTGGRAIRSGAEQLCQASPTIRITGRGATKR